MRRSLTWALAGLLMGVAAAAAAAQHAPPSQEQLKKQLEEKVGEAWVKDGGWITDYDQAREEAKKSGKLICAYFTRSYAT